MFEDKSSNSFEVTRNEKENGGNRLMAHFQNSAFLAQQEELSMFIKNLPLIRIEEVHSLNRLIELLIRQNQVLGAKCQQNVLTVKEMFNKHEELIRNNRSLQQQLSEGTRMVQYNSVNQKQMDSYEQQLTKAKEEMTRAKEDLVKAKEEIAIIKAEHTKMKVLGDEREETMVRLSEQTEQLISRNEHLQQSVKEAAQILQLISQRGFKKCIERVRELGNSGQKWADWSEIQRFAREERKRAKCLPKVRETVEVFCSRLFRVVELVGASGVRQEFEREVGNLLEILDDLLHLRRKNSLASSQSRVEGLPSQSGFFEAMLGKLIKESQSGGTARQEIAGQLTVVREELQECKNYYQQYLINARLQFETIVREKDQELTEKRQLLEFYQQERTKTSQEQKQWREKLVQYQQKMKTERANMQSLEQEVVSLSGKLQFARAQGGVREKQLREQWQENTKTYEYKLSQKQELVQEEQKQRRVQKAEFQQVISQLKGKISDLEEKENSLNQLNRELVEGNKQLSELIRAIQKKAQEEGAFATKQIAERNRLLEEVGRKREKELQQIKNLRQENEELQKQKSLQASYIKELQAKSKEVVAKIKTIQGKKTQEKTAKKEISAIKQSMLEQKKYTRQVEENLQTQREQAQRQREENQRLKSVIRQMKKQLEAVYQQFNDLKQIESDRERLIIDMQKSDRSRQEIIRSWESAKAELIRLQTQNRGLSLQVKHYRNALSRIEALRL